MSLEERKSLSEDVAVLRSVIELALSVERFLSLSLQDGSLVCCGWGQRWAWLLYSSPNLLPFYSSATGVGGRSFLHEGGRQPEDKSCDIRRI